MELHAVVPLELRIEVAAGRIEGAPRRRAPEALNRGRRAGEGEKGIGRLHQAERPSSIPPRAQSRRRSRPRMAGRSKRRRWRAREGVVVEPRPRPWFGAAVEHQRNRGRRAPQSRIEEEVAEVGGRRPANPGRAAADGVRGEIRGGDGELQHCSASHPQPPSPSPMWRRCGLFLARGSAPAARAGGSAALSPASVATVPRAAHSPSSAGPSPVPQPC
jgi:hypothetical protein